MQLSKALVQLVQLLIYWALKANTKLSSRKIFKRIKNCKIFFLNAIKVHLKRKKKRSSKKVCIKTLIIHSCILKRCRNTVICIIQLDQWQMILNVLRQHRSADCSYLKMNPIKLWPLSLNHREINSQLQITRGFRGWNQNKKLGGSNDCMLGETAMRNMVTPKKEVPSSK